MLKKLSSTQKRISKNIFSLAVLQGVNYILPLLTIPYLVRVLGLDLFGLLAFSTAIIMYFLLISDYGFNLSATNKIAINRDDLKKVNEIFCSVLFIKLSITVLGFLLMLLIVYLVPKLYKDIDIYIYTYGMVVGQALIPLWLFQGMEKMKYMTYFNILAKFVATGSIFILVQEQSDYYLVPILTSLGFIIAGILSLYWAFKEFKMSFYFPSKDILICELKDGWHVFISRIFVNLYSVTNTVILGFLTNNTIVGYYSLAEKIIGAVSGLFAPVTQAIYPYMSSLYNESKERFTIFFKKLIFYFVLIGCLFILTVVLFDQKIVELVSGEINSSVEVILVIISILLLTSPLGTLFTQTFIIKNETKLFIRVVQFTFLTNMILVLPMIYFFDAVGLAYTVFITQIVHMYFNIKYYLITRKRNKEAA